MKRSSLFRGFLAACALAAAFMVVAFRPAVDLVVATCRAAKNLVLDGFKLAVPQAESKSAVVVAFLQAKAFVLRLIKRDRPVVSTNWIMSLSN